MNFFKSSRMIAVITILGCLFGCSTTPVGDQYSTPHKNHQLNDISHLTNRERADLYEAIIAADLASANGEHEVATSYYLAAARLSGSIDLIQLSVESAKNADDSLGLLQAAELWLAEDPNNLTALALNIDGLLQNRALEEAVNFTRIYFQNQNDSKQRAKLLIANTKALSLPIANAYLSQIELTYPSSVAAIYAKAEFYSRAAKHTKSPSSVLQQAFTFINKALKIKGDFIPAIELKTRLFYQARQDEKAEAMLREAHAKYPKSSEINQLLGQLLYDLRKYNLAKQHYANWLEQHDEDMEARFFLAASHFATSDFTAALKNYKQIIGKDYKPQLSYFFCGNSATQIKQYEQAISCYERVESGSYLTRSKVELAKLYALKDEINRALKVVRNHANAVDEKGRAQLVNIEIEILYRHVDEQLAKERLVKAMQNYPDNLNLLFKKVKFEQLIDQPKILIPLLEKAEEKLVDEKNNHQFNLTIAGFLRNNGLYQQAVDWLNRALTSKPEDKEFLYARALYKEPLGLADEMIAEFKHLLSLDPSNVNIKNALGYTLVDVNQDLEYASKLIEQAYTAMPNNAAVIDSKGWLAYRNGAFDQAIQYLNLAFKIAPSADVAVHIGEVYWQKGEKDKAKNFWNKAKKMDEKNYLLATTIKKFGVSLSD